MKARLLEAISVAAAMLLVADAAGAAMLADVQVVERGSGKALAVYRQGGEYWVAGQPGRNYAVRIANRLDQRVMAVVSVDGINVITGKTASARPENGYVFAEREVSSIAGWRKSSETVAAFYFAYKEASYASRTGRPQDVGVIGVALFREKQQEQPLAGWSSARDAESRAGAAAESAVPEDKRGRPAPSAAAASREASAKNQASALGTGHGAVEPSHVETTEFTSATRAPEQIVRLRYDSYDNLVARGIIPKPRVQDRSPGAPNPFPADGYVPDPPQ